MFQIFDPSKKKKKKKKMPLELEAALTGEATDSVDSAPAAVSEDKPTESEAAPAATDASGILSSSLNFCIY